MDLTQDADTQTESASTDPMQADPVLASPMRVNPVQVDSVPQSTIQEQPTPQPSAASAIRTQIAALTPEKQQLVLQRLIERKRQNATAQMDQIFDLEPLPRDRDFPASYEQQYLWQRHKLSGHQVELVMDFPPLQLANVDVPALEASFSALIERHEALRTTFHEGDGQLTQRIHPSHPHKLDVVQFSRLRVMGVERVIDQHLIAMAEEPFDLSSGPLWRAKLLKRGKDSALLFTFCILIFDGESINIFVDELMALYEAYKQKAPITLPPLAVQGADYAEWQQRHLQRAEQQRNLEWWQKKLDGFQAFKLDQNQPLPHAIAYECTLYEQVISIALIEALESYAKTKGITLYMVMLTAFKLVLAEYSGLSEIVVGSPVSKRHVPQTEPLIGHFVNYLTLRTQLPTQVGFEHALQSVYQTVTEAFERQTTPHGLLSESLGLYQPEAPSPFRILFNYRNVDNPAFIDEQIQAGGENRSAQKETFEVEGAYRKFKRDEDLLLRLEDAGDAKVATWFVRNDAIAPVTVNQMIQRYQETLQSIIS